MKGNLFAEIVVQEQIIGTIKANDDISYTRGVPNYQEAYEGIIQPRIANPDIEKRNKAKKDLEILKIELKKTYR